MRFSSVEVALVAFFASTYAISVTLLAPISFDPRFQIRVADALLPLSIIFGFPAALGLGLGCFIANFIGPYGFIDAAIGGIANFVACVLAQLIDGSSIKHRFLGCLTETLTITVIVGGYLSLILGIPVEVGLLGLLVGSLISINILGFMLLEALYRRDIEKYVKNLR